MNFTLVLCFSVIISATLVLAKYTDLHNARLARAVNNLRLHGGTGLKAVAMGPSKGYATLEKSGQEVVQYIHKRHSSPVNYVSGIEKSEAGKYPGVLEGLTIWLAVDIFEEGYRYGLLNEVLLKVLLNNVEKKPTNKLFTEAVNDELLYEYIPAEIIDPYRVDQALERARLVITNILEDIELKDYTKSAGPTLTAMHYEGYHCFLDNKGSGVFLKVRADFVKATNNTDFDGEVLV